MVRADCTVRAQATPVAYEYCHAIPLDAVQPIRFRFETAVVFLAITLRGRRATVAHREEPESIRDVEKRLRDGSLTP